MNSYTVRRTNQLPYGPVIFAAPDTAPFAMFSAECTYEPLAVARADVMCAGKATISAMTDTCIRALNHITNHWFGCAYHLEALISELSGLSSGGRVNSAAFSVVLGRDLDLGHGLL